jgi:hypothetical protein
VVGVNKIPSLVAVFKTIWKSIFANLAIKMFQMLRNCIAMLSMVNFGRNPAFEALKVDDSNRSGTVARNDFWILWCFFGTPAESAGGVGQLLRGQAWEHLNIVVFAVFIVSHQGCVSSEFTNSKFYSPKLDDVILFNFVVNGFALFF